VTKNELSGLKFIPVGLFCYFFTPLLVNLEFPFVNLQYPLVPTFEDFKYFPEPTLGILATPFGIYSFYLVLKYLTQHMSNEIGAVPPRTFRLVRIFFVGSILSILLLSALIAGTTFRYQLDFYLIFIISFFVSLFSFNGKKSAHQVFASVGTFAKLSILLMIVTQFFLGFSGYLNSLSVQNPTTYQFLERIFEWPIRLILT
jgi:hypothetical protein